MPPLTFRNRLGERVDVPGIPASRAKGGFGRLVDQVSRGRAVAITRHDAPKAVLVSFAGFQALTAAGTASIDAPEQEFDAMLAPGLLVGVPPLRGVTTNLRLPRKGRIVENLLAP